MLSILLCLQAFYKVGIALNPVQHIESTCVIVVEWDHFVCVDSSDVLDFGHPGLGRA